LRLVTALRTRMTELSICIDYDDPLVAELLHSSLSQFVPHIRKALPSEADLQWSSYESISFQSILNHPQKLCNSYIFRKALIRKHFLANTIQNWVAKHPETILATAVPRTYLLECDYSDYLDEALNESFELREALELNENERENQKYFILKPSMTDRGQGIRLFSTLDELREIFEEFDGEDSDSEDSETGVMASQVRHFVVQEYISPPLLLDTNRRKFHIRAYVVAFGAIKVWVWSEMLALFAGTTYLSPSVAREELDRHLTNTCLQDGSVKDDSVLRFWSLPVPQDTLNQIYRQICALTGEVFLAAAAGQQMHFQVHPLIVR
jgi:tubulin---tyrosine ligase